MQIRTKNNKLKPWTRRNRWRYIIHHKDNSYTYYLGWFMVIEEASGGSRCTRLQGYQ